MSDLTLYEINQRLLSEAEWVRELATKYTEVSLAWAEAEREWRHARAVARPRLKSKLVSDREDELHLMTEVDWYEAELAKALREGTKEALRAAQAVLSGLQSAASAHREEARLARVEVVPA